MTTRILSLFRITIQGLLLGLVTAFILVACSGKSTSIVAATQPASPTQASTKAQQLAVTQSNMEIQTPAETQAAALTPVQTNVSGINACKLITKEEAETALASPVGDPIEENYPPLYGCRYESTGFNYVSITVTEFADTMQAENAFQMEIDLNDYPEVSGIGDRAIKPVISDISVLKGKYELSIDLANDDDKEIQYEKAKALALSALVRLP